MARNIQVTPEQLESAAGRIESLQQIPKGYDVKDLKIKVENSKVASVDESGIVIGKEPGSTVITIYTSDNKFSAYCALTVTEPSNVKFEPLCVLT